MGGHWEPRIVSVSCRDLPSGWFPRMSQDISGEYITILKNDKRQSWRDPNRDAGASNHGGFGLAQKPVTELVPRWSPIITRHLWVYINSSRHKEIAVTTKWGTVLNRSQSSTSSHDQLPFSVIRKQKYSNLHRKTIEKGGMFAKIIPSAAHVAGY